jgi:proline iminopeptidase
VWQVEPGISIRYFAAGAGPNVLVVHGGPGLPGREPWPGLQRLEDRFRFYYYDQRGCGGSSRPFDRFSSSNYFDNLTRLERTLGLGAQIADIERIRRLLGDERILLVGHSFGALLAALYAAEFPERVQGLVLVAPGMLVMPDAGADLFEQIARRLPEAVRPEFEAWRKRYLDFGAVFGKSERELAAEHTTMFEYYLRAAPRIQIPAHLEDARPPLRRSVSQRALRGA